MKAYGATRRIRMRRSTASGGTTVKATSVIAHSSDSVYRVPAAPCAMRIAASSRATSSGIVRHSRLALRSAAAVAKLVATAKVARSSCESNGKRWRSKSCR